MAFSAADVKNLREMTGAGMMDCKKALNETNGNMDEAVEFLRKNGQAKAEKKASRVAAEGVVNVAVDGDTKVLLPYGRLSKAQINSLLECESSNELMNNLKCCSG